MIEHCYKWASFPLSDVYHFFRITEYSYLLSLSPPLLLWKTKQQLKEKEEEEEEEEPE